MGCMAERASETETETQIEGLPGEKLKACVLTTYPSETQHASVLNTENVPATLRAMVPRVLSTTQDNAENSCVQEPSAVCMYQWFWSKHVSAMMSCWGPTLPSCLTVRCCVEKGMRMRTRMRMPAPPLSSQIWFSLSFGGRIL